MSHFKYVQLSNKELRNKFMNIKITSLINNFP